MSRHEIKHWSPIKLAHTILGACQWIQGLIDQRFDGYKGRWTQGSTDPRAILFYNINILGQLSFATRVQWAFLLSIRSLDKMHEDSRHNRSKTFSSIHLLLGGWADLSYPPPPPTHTHTHNCKKQKTEGTILHHLVLNNFCHFRRKGVDTGSRSPGHNPNTLHWYDTALHPPDMSGPRLLHKQ